MPDFKISQLPVATTPLTGAELVPVVQGGTTDRATVADFLKSAVAGSAAAPSVAFSANPNTGIFSPTADTFAVTTGGAERLRVSSTGNLGIGSTTTSTSRIYAETAARGIGFGTYSTDETASRSTYSAFAGLQLAAYQSVPGSPYTKTSDIVANADGTVPSLMRFWTKTSGDSSPTERMRLDASGNLGLGVTAPQAQLQVGAKLGSGSNTYSFSGYKFGVENGSTRLIGPEATTFGQTSIALDVVLPSAVAYANLTTLLQFSGRDRGNDFNSGVLGYIGINKVSAANAAGDGNLVFGTTAAGSFTSTERMRIDASGNLGLGVTPSASWFSGAAALQFGVRGGLASSSSYTGLTRNTIATSSGFVAQYLATAAASMYLQGSGTHEWFNAPSGTAGTAITFTQAMTLDASGNLGIGTTSPGAKLHINDLAGGGDLPRIRFTNGGTGTGATDGMFVGVSNTSQLDLWNFENNSIRFATNNTLQMTLDASGNLGLGTSTFGTSAADVLAIGSGTEPSTGPADTVQFFSVDRSAGNTIPGIRCEGTGVTDAAITNVTVTNKIAMKVNGTIYYLLATTSAA